MKQHAGQWLAGLAVAVLGLAVILTRPTAIQAKMSAAPNACPTTSTNTYVQGGVYQYDLDDPVRDAETNADKNIQYRGILSIYNERFHLVNYGPSSDSAQPPQFATLFAPYRRPRFVAGYDVFEWTWDPSPDPGEGAGHAASPYHITMMGLRSVRGEELHAPKHSRTLGAPFGKGGSIVLYANEHSITLKFTREDSVARGYTMHITGICTDPNLLALYRLLDKEDRNSIGDGSDNVPRDQIIDYELPGLTEGQVLGTARNRQIRVAIRDEGSFIDPRSRNDWWRIR